MIPSDKLYAFTQGWEKCRLQRYLDSEGLPTIGWGHLLDEKGEDKGEGMCWSREQADQAFSEDLQWHADQVAELTNAVTLTQSQFDALVDFAYHKGVGALRNSTLLKRVLARDWAGAAMEFGRWGGVPADHGQLRRSVAEQAIWLAGDYSRRP